MFSLSLIALPFLLLPWLSSAEDPIHVELLRRNPSPLDYGREAERLRDRYGFRSSNATLSGRATGAFPIINQGRDTSYIANIKIGTTPQQLSVVLDTGSTDLWVATTACASCMRETKLFNSANSSTFTSKASQVSISYGSGTVTGIVAEDTVSMGVFTVPNQTFLGVTELGSNLIDGAVSGIMGLAWPSLATTSVDTVAIDGLTSSPADPFWLELARSGALTTRNMSFWLKREIDNPSPADLTDGGVFTLGGVNDTLYAGDIEWLPVVQVGNAPSFWLLELSRLTLSGSPISVKTGSSALCAIDTGTTLIGGPSADVRAFWGAVPGASPSTTEKGFYTFPCDTKISVAMAFGGKSWPIDPVDMNLGQASSRSTRCVGAIFDLSLGSAIPSGGPNPSWVVGATFLKNVYSIFQASTLPPPPPRNSEGGAGFVGFAQLSSAAGGSSGAAVVDSSAVPFTKTRSGPDSTNTAPNSNTTSSSSILSASIICVTIAVLPSLLYVL